jgi:phosphoribosyl-AMP cyclohydrolase
VVATSARTGEVLMLAYMNEEALARTIETGEAHYWSRSRGRLWRKGEESGNSQRVVEMRTDCDQDAILLKVRQTGAACHTGRRSCFYRVIARAAPGSVSLSFVDAGDSSTGGRLPSCWCRKGQRVRSNILRG